jgi:hypothetical protein
MDDRDLIQRVRQEHARLRDIKDSLVATLERAPEKGPSPTWLTEIRDSFEHFRAHLIHRIALEQIGGFLNVVLERRPTLAKQVEHLKEGHAQMIEMAGTTMAELRKLDPTDPQAVTDAGLLVNMALSEVKYHEEAETFLVSFVFTQDTRGGD